jgi:hypothetical protein
MVAPMPRSTAPARRRHGRVATLALAAVLGLGGLAAARAQLHAAPGRDAAGAPEATSTATATQVVGAVVDREGRGVGGATVIARPVAMPVAIGLATRTFQAITDAAGRFQMNGLPPGTYWFIALHAAHGTAVGSSPAVPVVDRVEVAIRLDDAPVDA